MLITAFVIVQFEKLAELSEDVQRLIDQYNGTRVRQKGALYTLVVTALT